MDPWYVENLICPVHKAALAEQCNTLTCAAGCEYPIVFGIPCMLVHDRTDETFVRETLRVVQQGRVAEHAGTTEPTGEDIDPWVQENIFSSNSNIYRHLGGTLKRYPIPDIPFEATSQQKMLLDIGCNWGRWCLAAARKGYQPVGIDPWLPSVLAAVRVSRQLGIPTRYVIADCRLLPFRPGLFDVAYSYSTLQHLSKDDVKQVLAEVKSVLKQGGLTKLHLLNRFGLRSIQTQVIRRFQTPQGFQVRFWSPAEMIRECERLLGPSRLEVDGFFSQGRPTDLDLLPLHYRLLVRLSNHLKKLNTYLPAVGRVADQMFVVSRAD